MKINLTYNFTTMVTGHGKTKSYLHRFKIIEELTCPCGNGDQTTDHFLFEYDLLNKERDTLKLSVVKANVWSTSKSDLIKKYYKEFTKFINEIPFDELKVAYNSSNLNCKLVKPYCIQQSEDHKACSITTVMEQAILRKPHMFVFLTDQCFSIWLQNL